LVEVSIMSNKAFLIVMQVIKLNKTLFLKYMIPQIFHITSTV